jgi:hypothetical protein
VPSTFWVGADQLSDAEPSVGGCTVNVKLGSDAL